MTDVPLSPGLQRLAETFNEPIQWAAGYPLVPLCQVMYPMTTGGTPHVELTEAYGLTRAGRFVPRPTEWGRSTEMMELSRGERENREDFRRAVAEKKATLVQVKAMPVNRPGLDPSPFSTWSGPWNRKEEALWRKLSKQEKRDWSKKFQAWKNDEWAKENSGVPEPAQGPRASGSKDVVEVTSEPGVDGPEVAMGKAGAPLPEGAEDGAMPEGGAVTSVTVPESGAVATPKAPSTPEGLLSSQGDRSRRRRRRRRSPSSSSTPSGEGRSRRRRWVPPAPPWFWPGLMPQMVGPLPGAIPKVSPPLDAYAARGLPRPPPAP